MPSHWQKAPMVRGQLVVFATRVEDVIPLDHPVRLLDELLEQLDWSDFERLYPSRRGQPPIHPRHLAKVLLYAMMRGIWSSRRIEDSLRYSLDFMWLAEGRPIDHTTLSEFRRKHGDRLKELNTQLIEIAKRLGLAKLGEVCVDGTRVQANASRLQTLTAAKVDALIKELTQGDVAAALESTEQADLFDELTEDGCRADQLPPKLADREQRIIALQAVRDQLLQMEADRRREGIDPQKKPAQLPAADPDARILPNKAGGYSPNYTPMLVTESCTGLVVGASVEIGNVEHARLVPLLEQVEADHGERPGSVLADGAFATGPNISVLEERGIEFYSPLPGVDAANNPAVRDDPTQPVPAERVGELPINPQTKRLDKSAFVYDAEQDCYFCPEGKRLDHDHDKSRRRHQGRSVSRVYMCLECAGCPLLDICHVKPGEQRGRGVSHDSHDAARRRHAERMRQEESKQRYKRRFHTGEVANAFIKSIFNFRRFATRGHESVTAEWNLAALAYNCFRMRGLMAEPCAEPCAELDETPAPAGG